MFLKRSGSRLLALATATAMAAIAATMPARAGTELVVYTAVEAEDLQKYAARFNEDHPDITIEHTHDLAQPNLGWNHTALAVWYTEA